jgi:hypothetical protein
MKSGIGAQSYAVKPRGIRVFPEKSGVQVPKSLNTLTHFPEVPKIHNKGRFSIFTAPPV